MKIKELLNNLDQRAAALGNSSSSQVGKGAPAAASDHDYYLDMGIEPPRFAQYRLARTRYKVTQADTYDDVWNRTTQEELDYSLKLLLRKSTEEQKAQVIAEHNKRVEWYKQRNAIVEPSVLLACLTPAEQKQPYYQEYWAENDQP